MLMTWPPNPSTSGRYSDSGSMMIISSSVDNASDTNNQCRFVLWKDNAFFKRLGKRLDAHVADKLLRDGRVRLKDCKSAKGKTYNATVLLSCEADGRSKFSLEFEGGC